MITKSIPKGYKQTEIGVIPEDWDDKTLLQVVDKNGLIRGPFGGSLKKEFFVKKGIKVYEQKNAIYRTIELGDYFINQKKYFELKRFEVFPGDFIVSCSGTIGRIFLIPDDAPKGIINQALLIIRLKPSKVDKKYFFYYFDWEKFQETIIDNTQGGAMKNLIGMEEFKKTKFAMPRDIKEQRLIARVLSDTDELIEKLDKLIAKKKNIKKGAMQLLLTGKKRLPGFSGEWEVKKLGDIVEFIKGSGLSKTKVSSEGRFECILYGELFTTYNEIIKFVVSRTNFEEGTPSINGDILMPGSTTTIGIDLAVASALLKENVLLGGDVNILRKKSDQYNSEYLANYLTHIKKYEIAEITQGTTIIHLYGKYLEDLEIRIPPTKQEQTAIARVLSDMDTEIEALERKRDKYKMIKEGMMQQLLTGKIRLKVD